MKIKDIWANHKESEAMKERAYRELCYAAVIINRYYHLMIAEKDKEARVGIEASYFKAREAFQHKAEIIDAIFKTRTVLIEGLDDEGNIVEISFESHPA